MLDQVAFSEKESFNVFSKLGKFDDLDVYFLLKFLKNASIVSLSPNPFSMITTEGSF